MGKPEPWSHRNSRELLGQRAAMEKQKRGQLQDRGGEKTDNAVVSRCPVRQRPTPHYFSPKAQCRPGDWLRQRSLARLLIQRQEGQLREGGFQPQHSTVQVNAALPWGPRMCVTSLPAPTCSPSFCLSLLPCPCPFRERTVLLSLLWGLIK